MEKKMFFGANPLIFGRAKDLRLNMTKAEITLWDFLKTKPLGYKFRRQHPLGIYIADFFCYKLSLVIEVDGGIHDQEDVREYDEVRQKLIEADNIKVLRFTNDEVINQFKTVTQKITTIMNEQQQKESSLTPPLGGRGVSIQNSHTKNYDYHK